MNKSGKYPLHVKVTDSSGNETEWDLNVEVVDQFPYYENTAERTAFADFVKANKGDGRSFGIDVSAWQDDINFKAVKKAGCEFVIIRIGYTYEGELHIDKTFYQNYSRARAAGLKIGFYYYSTDNTEEQVRSAAEWISKTLNGASPDLPIAFDWEDFGNYQDYGMSLHELNKLYDAFADELAKDGYGCMLYSSKNYLENAWEKTDTRPVWLAHYAQKTDYKGPYMLWQASCTGRISGISGDVDMDILFNKN
jgi:GH25 family lysozyme M1 (1,4-beta-N-acetylmuramidase)